MGKIKGDAAFLSPLVPKYQYNSYWSSPNELAKFVEANGSAKAWDDCAWSQGDPEWSGSKSMGETITMAKTGWPEGAERVSRIRDYVTAHNPVRKQNVQYGIAGTTPCVPRAVAGDINNMRMPASALSKRRPIITLVSNMGAYCHVQSKMISNRSAAVAAIIDQIEAAGFCVEVIAISPCKSYSKWSMCTTVLVKPSHMPTDIGRLAFGLGQASMFRRLAFADRALEPIAREGLGHGMGGTIQLERTEEMKDKDVYLLPSNNVMSELFEDELTTATKGVEWLIEQLREQGCPAFPKPPGWKPKEEKKEVNDF